MKKKHQPTNKEIFEAYENFKFLLKTNTLEADWQRFFTKNPFVFSRALPLKIEHRTIMSFGRPGKSEPDFIFYPQKNSEYPTYGVIEIKRPDTPILTSPRKNIILLTREADTAIKQAQKYANSIKIPDRTLFLGSNQYIFIIMGLSKELGKKIADDITCAYLNTLLPPQCQLLPYDLLLHRFEKTIPKKLIVLAPDFLDDKKIIYEYVNRLTSQDRMLIILKKQLYGNNWNPMFNDLKKRLNEHPYIYKLCKRIQEDLFKINEMCEFEIKYKIDLFDFCSKDFNL